MRFLSSSAAETLSIGQELGSKLQANAIVSLFGELGAGKTTLIKGLTSGAIGCPEVHVSSPTFAYLNIYSGTREVRELYHFDLYRLSGSEDFIGMGFDEFLDAGGICCIEWAERIAPLLPAGTIEIFLTHAGGDQRAIEIRKRI